MHDEEKNKSMAELLAGAMAERDSAQRRAMEHAKRASELLKERDNAREALKIFGDVMSRRIAEAERMGYAQGFAEGTALEEGGEL